MKISLTARTILSALLVFFTLSPLKLRAEELNAGMARIAREFSSAARKSGLKNETVSVLPFQSRPELAVRKYDQACTEMLTGHLIRAGAFRIIERSRVEAIEQERRLESSAGMAGRTDTGPLRKSKLIVIGYLSRLVKSYAVSSQLIEANTGVIIASATAEVPIGTFDREADYYLSWPETAVGIGLIGSYFPISVKQVPPKDLAQRVFPSNAPGALIGAGITANFYLHRRWLMNFSLFPALRISPDSAEFSAGQRDPDLTEWRGLGMQFTLNRGFRLGRSVRALAGVGAGAFRMDNENDNSLYVDAGPANAEHIEIKKQEFSSVYPFIRLGAEWQPANKLGFSIFGNYSLLAPRSVTEHATLSTIDGELAGAVVRKFSLPQFTTTAALIYYF